MSKQRLLPITRRHFVSMTGASAALAALPAALWAKQSAPPCGIQLYTVSELLNQDPADTLRKIAAIGYQEVETAGFAKLTAANFGKLVRDAGLRVPSAHLGFGAGDTSALLEQANALGAHFAVSSTLLPSPQSTGDTRSSASLRNSLTMDDFKRIAAAANKIGEQAKAAGLQYAYHNHDFEFRDLGDGQTGYNVLLDETDTSVVQFEADCGWMCAAGKDPIRYFKKYPGRFVMVHIKDFAHIERPAPSNEEVKRPVPAELGRGEILYGPIVAAAKSEHVQHFFIEQEPPFRDMPAIEAAAVDYRALRALLRT